MYLSLDYIKKQKLYGDYFKWLPFDYHSFVVVSFLTVKFHYLSWLGFSFIFSSPIENGPGAVAIVTGIKLWLKVPQDNYLLIIFCNFSSWITLVHASQHNFDFLTYISALDMVMQGVMVAYPFLWLLLYLHMFRQRRSKLMRKGGSNNRRKAGRPKRVDWVLERWWRCCHLV